MIVTHLCADTFIQENLTDCSAERQECTEVPSRLLTMTVQRALNCRYIQTETEF